MKTTVTIYLKENRGDTLNLVYNVLDAYDKNYEVRGKTSKKRRIIIKGVETDLFCSLAQIPDVSLWA